MRILMMGGTRFIGVYLTKILAAQGHEVVLFNRGNKPVPVSGVKQILGDRTKVEQLQEQLSAVEFDAVFDNNGRELSDTKPLAEIFKGRVQHFVYMSSAGVYLKSDQMPHIEGDAESGLPWTSIRPTYIYGPQNYNDLEAWFFDRIARDRPIPIPGNGMHFTQLGHCQDLAGAMAAVLGNERAIGQIYNVSGDRFVTFDGLARACIQAAGKSPDAIKIVHYDPKQFDFGKKKAFPMRLQHFFASVNKAVTELNWKPYLVSGRDKAEIDFSVDDEILKAV
ncbi:MAG: NAD-dependent epimerase/dehydratase family protein [Oscillatoriales cyanobacterium]|nr:MAG: NAD-dependent epimerase/dehydratase family protein [Oscillatoriales cyanobacterium]